MVAVQDAVCSSMTSRNGAGKPFTASSANHRRTETASKSHEPPHNSPQTTHTTSLKLGTRTSLSPQFVAEVILDHDFRAHIGDFWMARVKSVEDFVMGTVSSTALGRNRFIQR